MEADRIAASRPKFHLHVDRGRVYCPEYDKIRPDFMCEREHGDYHEIVDKEE
jgi:hypothetical protein